ncbi:glycosyltransferase [Aeromicrobium duanguangcaii]|uniref:glycosyltransferase n=1 Tax=Aeromicrobium duanguangcaii TaxID=2968086 RepID=UPI002017180F|nr:glycosyltransferase [Aeromicrobium duanguangcaii]
MSPSAAAPGEPATPFPAGAWFSVVGNVRLGAGGQTRMVLLRHRLFVAAGLDFPILTYNPVPSYEPIRAGLLADGLLLPQSRLVNLHEDLRERDLAALPSVDVPPVPRPDRTKDDVEDGYTWRRRHVGADGAETTWEYLRPDGTTYAFTPADDMAGDTRVLDRDGRVVLAGDGLGDLWRWWTRQLAPAAGPVFLVSDSRFVAEELGLLDDPRFVLMHQMHNPHLRGDRRWDSPIEPSYASSLEHVDRFDALNTLTERQRHDLRLRFGDLPQFHVLANPVEAVEPPSPPPARIPGRIVVIARLHPQKQLDRAIDAFALVAPRHPTATLEIYGDGDEEQKLRDRAAERGVADRVVFHGHVPDAADRLWEADLAWLTSRFEGYGLFILEARMRECPVLAFDVPYGPAEQIESGVDGVLVPAGDAARLAHATLDLLAARERLESMRGRARAGAIAHGHESFLADWAQVAREALDRKPTRVRLDDVRVDLRGREARVHVEGTGDLADVRLRWQAWQPGDAGPTDLTTSLDRDGATFTVRAGRAPRGARERLLLTWQNASWQQDVPRRRWWRRG